MWYRRLTAQTEPYPRLMSSNRVAEYIDRMTDAHLSVQQIKRELAKHGLWWELADVDPRTLRISDATGVDPTKAQPSKGPCVVDGSGEVVDGRHRVMRAIADNMSTIQVYRPRSAIE